MKNIILLAITVIAFTACKQTTNESIQTEPLAMNSEKVDKTSDWVNLFDGTNFDQWRGYLSEDMYPEWTIEDGAMVYTPGKGGGKNIITKNTYTDFVLSLEWKISEGGNSGFFWSVYEDPKFKEAYQTGPEIQVLDNAKHPDSFVPGGTHKAGSLYDMIACPPALVNPAGEWNLCVLEINHKTNLGKISMNGKEAFTFPVQGEGWDKMVENSKFKGWEGFGMHHTGHIGLQDHGNKVWFRNIKIKEL
jgi:hypothetical protein